MIVRYALPGTVLQEHAYERNHRFKRDAISLAQVCRLFMHEVHYRVRRLMKPARMKAEKAYTRYVTPCKECRRKGRSAENLTEAYQFQFLCRHTGGKEASQWKKTEELFVRMRFWIERVLSVKTRRLGRC